MKGLGKQNYVEMRLENLRDDSRQFESTMDQ